MLKAFARKQKPKPNFVVFDFNRETKIQLEQGKEDDMETKKQRFVVFKHEIPNVL